MTEKAAMAQASAGCILIVDDTPANLSLLTKLFTDTGYEVRVAPNGKLALQSVLAQPPDLILLDIRMPQMDGYTVCKTLKANPLTVDIPVIFLSALNASQDKLSGFEAGGVDYVAKPFDPPEVLARVATHMRIRELQAELEEKNSALRAANEELARLATTDPLTSLPNRRSIQTQAEASLSCAKRYATPFSVILFDLDYFKSINDRYGHEAGDLTLKTITARVQSAMRETDTLSRWGGEEFLILAPQSTIEDSCRVAQRLCQHLASEPVESIGVVTASFGVAEYVDGDTLATVVQKADKAMYTAKQAGRNRVACAGNATAAATS